MTPEQLVGILGAITALVIAIGGIIVQVHQLRKDLNGRLTQLVESVGEANRKEGELAGRDHVRREVANITRERLLEQLAELETHKPPPAA